MGWFSAMFRKKGTTPEIDRMLEADMPQAFPGGAEQIEHETAVLQPLVQGRLSLEETRGLLVHCKVLGIIAQDPSELRMAGSIRARTRGKFDQATALAVCRHLAAATEKPNGSGDGSRVEETVVIHATRSGGGVRSEYRWLEPHFGQRDEDWELISQALMS